MKTRQTKSRSAYPAHIITMIYNPLAAQKQRDDQPATEVLPFTVPETLALDRTFIQTLNRIQAKRLAVYYPDNFYLHFTQNVLHSKRPIRRPDIITLPRLARLLAHDNTKLLAWCWYFSVQWIFLTETLFVHCATVFSDTDGLVIQGQGDQIIRVSAGITFDESVEGLFLFERRAMQILFNPLHLDKTWLIADVIDLAIHECTHCLARKHDEQFIQIESMIRKELRRIVDEQRILADARDILAAFD